MNLLIENLAGRIAKTIKEASPEETTSVEVMKFALIGIIHNSIIVITALIFGIIFNNFVETVICCISFMGLRLVSGGYHFKTALSCFIFSTIVFVTIPFIQLPNNVLLYINIVSLILCIVFSPSNIKAHIRVSEKYFFIFKLASIIVVSLNFLLNNPIITLSFLTQSVTLIYFKGGDNK